MLIRSDLVRGRKEFIDDETFFMHGDTATCHEILMSSDFGFVHQVLTFTRRHESATDTPKAVALNSYIAARTMILKRYGRSYLDEREYEARVDTRLREYYTFLGRNLYAGRDIEFWRFHYRALKAIGYPLDYRRLVRASLEEDKQVHALHPLKTIGGLIGTFGALRRVSREDAGQVIRATTSGDRPATPAPAGTSA